MCRLSDYQTNSQTQKLEILIDDKQWPGEFAEETITDIKVISKRSPEVIILENEKNFGT